MNIIQKPIPNTHYSEGRESDRVEAVVFHATEGTTEATYQEFLAGARPNPTILDCNHSDELGATANPVSSHYLVTDICVRGGLCEIWQFVAEKDTSYGCGIVNHPTSVLAISKRGRNPNGWVVNVEHTVPKGSRDISQEMYNTSIQLTRYLFDKYLIPYDRIHAIKHREIRSTKTCPIDIDVDKIVKAAELLSHPLQPLPSITASSTQEEVNQVKISILQRIVEALLKLLKLQHP